MELSCIAFIFLCESNVCGLTLGGYTSLCGLGMECYVIKENDSGGYYANHA
jgi:hypothetical protein